MGKMVEHELLAELAPGPHLRVEDGLSRRTLMGVDLLGYRLSFERGTPLLHLDCTGPPRYVFSPLFEVQGGGRWNARDRLNFYLSSSNKDRPRSAPSLVAYPRLSYLPDRNLPRPERSLLRSGAHKDEA